GLNHLLSPFATCQTVIPPSPAWSSGHLRMAPPKSSSFMPRCFSYQAARALWSPLTLKKTPPIPVTLAIAASSPVTATVSLPRRLPRSYRKRSRDGWPAPPSTSPSSWPELVPLAQRSRAGQIPPRPYQLGDLPDVTDVVQRPLVKHLRERH